MKLISIQVGQPRQVEWEGKFVSTSIFKDPIPGPVWVRHENIEGDRQADLRVHGGREKAVYAYGLTHYQFWKSKLGLPQLPPGSFGENLTLSQLDESHIYIGDTYSLGDCELQAVQPRMPCFKLGIKFGDMEMVQKFLIEDRPGVYFQVLKEGQIDVGQTLRLLDSEPHRLSVNELYSFYKKRKSMSPERAEEVMGISCLPLGWREKLRLRAEE